MIIRSTQLGILPFVVLVSGFLAFPTADWRERLALAIYFTEATKIAIGAINELNNWRKER